MKTREEVLEGAKKVFFKAMLAGYAGKEANKTKTSDGYTTIEYSEEDFRVVDRYLTTPNSDYSAGTTTIFFENKPVWFMAYAGRYSSEVIPFLKSVLRRSYESELFVGGRGLEVYREGGLIYNNDVAENDFSYFCGRESIFYSKEGSREYFHDYFGMALI